MNNTLDLPPRGYNYTFPITIIILLLLLYGSGLYKDLIRKITNPYFFNNIIENLNIILIPVLVGLGLIIGIFIYVRKTKWKFNYTTMAFIPSIVYIIICIILLFTGAWVYLFGIPIVFLLSIIFAIYFYIKDLIYYKINQIHKDTKL